MSSIVVDLDFGKQTSLSLKPSASRYSELIDDGPWKSGRWTGQLSSLLLLGTFFTRRFKGLCDRLRISNFPISCDLMESSLDRIKAVSAAWTSLKRSCSCCRIQEGSSVAPMSLVVQRFQWARSYLLHHWL